MNSINELNTKQHRKQLEAQIYIKGTLGLACLCIYGFGRAVHRLSGCHYDLAMKLGGADELRKTHLSIEL